MRPVVFVWPVSGALHLRLLLAVKSTKLRSLKWSSKEWVLWAWRGS
jgi:hypothetical protein